MANDAQTTVRILLLASAQKSIRGVSYISPWALNIAKPDGTVYDISVLNKGERDTWAGIEASQYWRNDPDTLLQLYRSEEMNGELSHGPIRPEDVNDIKEVLAKVTRGEQEVTDQDDVSMTGSFQDEIISFVTPRIGIASENLDEDNTVRVGFVESILEEQREGREEPPMPLT